jgi:FlaA1/EpsC-like NDP-sugar epimerase
MLVREIGENRRLHYNTIGFIDDDRSKLHQTIHGVPVLGTVDEVGNILSKNGVDEIIIAIRSATATQMRRLVSACEASGLPSKILPTTCDLLNGKITTGEVREICYEDLLGRESANINVEQIGGYLAGKRIMVTGGVGSIGSELCRQIAQFKPERLVIIDRSESGLYDAEIDFAFNHPEVGIYPILGSVQNQAFMQRVFRVHEPQVVFHAAAYKHVPMMEVNPWEAVFNIIVGSKAILDLSKENKVEMCVIVSTDKAVRPTSVMGASKRVVELMTQAYAAQNNVRFMAVRFGNVLGTAGSVLPLFEKQIERGGPVTVTHPDVTRYFMTIAEACSLILQSGALGKGGEIFVLKMGTPIRIKSSTRVSGPEKSSTRS